MEEQYNYLLSYTTLLRTLMHAIFHDNEIIDNLHAIINYHYHIPPDGTRFHD